MLFTLMFFKGNTFSHCLLVVSPKLSFGNICWKYCSEKNAMRAEELKAMKFRELADALDDQHFVDWYFFIFAVFII